MKINKLIAWVLVCIVLVSLVSTGCQSNGTTKYKWPIELLNTTGYTAEETKNDYEANWHFMFENISINNDGSMTITCTEEQRLLWIEHFGTFLSETIFEWAESYNMSIWISEDRKKVELTTNPDEHYAFHLVTMISVFQSQCYLYQLFSNVPKKDILVSFSIINEKTGNVVASDRFPGGSGIELNPEDWN